MQQQKSIELRHLDGAMGNFGVSDTEYIAVSTTSTTLSESKSITTTIMPHAVYSSVIQDLQQYQYLFEILWNNATPAQQRRDPRELIKKWIDCNSILRCSVVEK